MLDDQPNKVIDFHTHIGDVCAGCYETSVESKCTGTLKANILEQFGFPSILQKLVASRVFPRKLLFNAAKEAASFSNPENLISDMVREGITSSVVLPIEPYVTTDEVLSSSQRFVGKIIPLISVDFRGSALPIRQQIHQHLQKYPFRGIKFHPNLQGIHPLSDAAKNLYNVARLEKLFVLVHGGITPIKFNGTRNFAIDKNLFPALKLNADVKFVVAHAGGYFANANRFLQSVKSLSNVSIDTSGIGAKTVLEALTQLGPHRVIFASDWPYGSQSHSIARVRWAVRNYHALVGGRLSLFERLVFSDNALELLS